MFISTKKTTTFRVKASVAPRIVISPEAIAKMSIYVDTCNDEVGWLGTADMFDQADGRVIFIDDTFLPHQEVHSTTTELTPDGLAEIAMELLSKPDGDKVWNRMRMWGHSHVNMGTSPSGQDDKQMQEFSTIGHDWFVRLIANKKGDIRVDFYDYKSGITMLDLNWETVEQDDAVLTEINTQIEELYAQIDVLEKAAQERRDGYVNSIKPTVVEEMKAKVKKKTYARPAIGYTQGKFNHMSHHGSEAGFQTGYNAYGNYPEFDPYYMEDDEEDLPYTLRQNQHDFVFLSSEKYVSDVMNKKKHLTDYFSDEDAIELASNRGGKDLEKFIEDAGYSQTFTREEAEQLRALAIKHYSKYIGA